MVLWYGGVIKSKEVIYSTPSHVTYGIYIFRKDQAICVSNSLYLLMAYNELEMDTEYAGYEIDFNSIRKGLDEYTQKIRVLNKGNTAYVEVFYYANIVVDEKGNCSITRKQLCESFKNYDDYYNRLMHSMLMLKENACDKNRNKQYGVVSTISRGYDASCCAVVGRKMGATTACTFAPCGKHKDDCGDDIARKLGYTNIVIRGHDAYKTMRII